MTDTPLVPTPDDPWGYRGRRVVVTGAASGIGAAASRILVGLGAEVVGLDLRPVEVDGVAFVEVDLGDPDSVAAAAAAVGGPIDAVFNCAGIPGTAPPRTVFAVNFCGTRELTERLVPSMSRGGAICNIGSTAAVKWPYGVDRYLELLGIDDYTKALDWLEANGPELGYPYDVAKEAINVYTCWRAVSLNDVGIRMNCINPASTRTPASREFAKAVKAKAGGADMLEHWPTLMGRMAKPEEQAWPMVFLNSPYASYVSGTTTCIDAGLVGGLYARQHHPAVAAGMAWCPPRPDDRTA